MAPGAVQLGFRDREFHPVPGGTGHYVAVVQNKLGELTALSQASTSTWERMTPLIAIVGPKRSPVAYRRETISNWLRRVAGAVGNRPFYLDTLRLRPGIATAGSAGDRRVLAVIHAEARRRGLTFVPVLAIGGAYSSECIELVRDAAWRDGRGAALRYRVRLTALQPGVTHASLLEAALNELEVGASCADVMIDLSYIAPDDELQPGDVGEVLQEVLAVGPWRSVVLLGTSMPSMLGSVPEGTVGLLLRREWDLWLAVRRRMISHSLTYGDYVIQHPEPPREEGGGGPSMRANIRYTVQSHTLVARGRGALIQVGREQYRELCQQLVDRPEFAGPAYSWGDAQIAACAADEIDPEWQSLWRGAGSSHHFRLVTDQLTE